MEKLKRILLPLVICSLSFFVVFASFKATEIHRLWLRAKVADKIYQIKGTVDGGGGTGFAVQAPGGTSYVVTNSHVCEYALKDAESENIVLVIRDGHAMKRRVLEISGEADLCLIEGWPGVKGLELGSSSKVSDVLYVIGHPLLLPITMQSGEVTSFEDVRIMHHIMKSGNAKRDNMFGATDEPCNQPKNEIRVTKVFLFGFIPMGEVKMCLVKETKAINTSIVIYPGNSGSPLVDKWGNVVGVVFAGDNRTNWGSAVNLENLTNFLKDF